MPFPQDQVAWLLAKRKTILRYAFVPQLLVAMVFFGFAYSTGKTDMHLLLKGARAEGKIVGFQQRRFYTSPNRVSTGTWGYNVYLPIVEFEAEGTLARFEEHKLILSGEGIGWAVPLLYDPSDPSVAIIDRGFWNWLPWAPCFLIGLPVAFASLKGFFAFFIRRAPAADLSPSR